MINLASSSTRSRDPKRTSQIDNDTLPRNLATAPGASPELQFSQRTIVPSWHALRRLVVSNATQRHAAQKSSARNRTQRSARPRRPKRPLTAIEQAQTCRSEITTSAPASAPAPRASNSVSPALATPHAHALGRMAHIFRATNVPG